MLAVLLLLTFRLALAGDDSTLAQLAGQDAWRDVEDVARARLAEQPEDGEALYWLARAEFVQVEGLARDGFAGRMRERLIEEAGAHLARAAESNSPVQAQASEWQGLAAWAEDFPGLDPARLEARWNEKGWPGTAYVRGLLALDAGELESADTWLARAAEGAPGRGDVLLARADALSALGRRDAAVEAWRAASAGDFPALVTRDELPSVLARILPARTDAARRLALLDELVARPEWQNDAWIAWYRAYALEELGRLPEALAAFDAGTAGSTPLIARAHARALSLNDRPLDAVEILRPLAEQHDWEAFGDLVSVADRLGRLRRFDEAVAVYDQVLAIEPRDERTLRNRAITLWRAGHDERAAAAFHDLCERLPGRSDLLNDAALAAIGRGDRASARALLEQACELPGSLDARENLAELLLGTPGAGPNQAESARIASLLDSVLAEDPSRARSLVLRLRLSNASL